MAESVERIPSQDSPDKADANPVNETESAFGVKSFLCRLSAFFEKCFSPQTNKQEFIIALFGVINLYVSKLIIQSGYFSPVYLQLDKFRLVVFSLLALPLAYFSLKSMFQVAVRDASDRMLSVSAVQSISVILAGLFLIYSLIFNFRYLHAAGLETDFYLLVFLLSAFNYAESSLFCRILQSTGFDPEIYAGYACVVADTNTGKFNTESELKIIRRAITEIKPGDLLQLEQGQSAAFDGVVIDGSAQALVCNYSGKGKPGLLKNADLVYSGTKILSGRIVYKVTSLLSESRISDFSSVLNQKLTKNSSQTVQSFKSNQTIINLLFLFFAVGAGIYWISRFGNLPVAVSVSCSILFISLLARYMRINLIMPVFADTAGFNKGIFYSKGFETGELNKFNNLVIDYQSEKFTANLRLVNVNILDKRVDEASLPSVLFSLAGSGVSIEAQAVTDYITKNEDEIKIYQCLDFAEFFNEDMQTDDLIRKKVRGRGLAGKVSGVDFSLGGEEFLLERGVLVQASDVDPEDHGSSEYFWYMALNREVIAALRFSGGFSQESVTALQNLRSANVRTVLCSLQNDQEVDQAGKALGFELVDIFGGMTEENYIKKLESLKPLILYHADGVSSKQAETADIRISVFNQFEYDLKKADILLFENNLETLSKSLLIPKMADRINKVNYFTATTLSLMLLVFSVLSLISPLVCLLTVSLASVAILLNMLRLTLI